MSGNRKIFLKGLVVGVIAVIWVNVVFSGAMSAYKRWHGGELTIDQKVDLIFTILDNTYVGEYDIQSVKDGMFTGMLYGVGDKYTSYMTREEFKRFMEFTEGTYVGIGSIVSSADDGSVLIVFPYEDAPAYNAGLLPGDKIIKIDGIDTRLHDLETSVSMIQGLEGTSVNVSVYRESESKIFDVDITRERVEIPTVRYKILDDNIGFISISAFERVTYNQFYEAYTNLLEKEVEGLIIDVRNNPGGLLDVVVDITNLLVPEGIIVYTQDKHGNQTIEHSDENYIQIPLVVLVNENSASASEVLAGAIMDHEIGFLVGEQTFGKGLVQNIFPLPDGSAIKVTIATYYTPNGISIHGEGLTPNYIVPVDETTSQIISALSVEEDIQLQKAIDVINREIGR